MFHIQRQWELHTHLLSVNIMKYRHEIMLCIKQIFIHQFQVKTFNKSFFALGHSIHTSLIDYSKNWNSCYSHSKVNVDRCRINFSKQYTRVN